jgi:hypothetical protein
MKIFRIPYSNKWLDVNTTAYHAVLTLNTEIEAWLNENCVGKWKFENNELRWYTKDDFIVFYNDNDYLLFILRWTT